ncbi:hypothetical protein PM082_001044 [Marasmius tenuissimus]|nr:hypothetical protein PM082_001044 [Marasmius tenuissimus]
MRLRLVTFDILHTLITPRWPVHVQYARVFENFLGGASNLNLDPSRVKAAFKVSLSQLQVEKPVYIGDQGSRGWWQEVIKRTILGSCKVDESLLEAKLPQIHSHLMHQFSCKEGYKAFDDALPTLERLEASKILTAAVSNSDSRMHAVLQSLSFPSTLSPVLLSEEEGIEKPEKEVFLRALARVNDAQRSKHGKSDWEDIAPHECLHIGDDVVGDYQGAQTAGFKALLLLRKDDEGQTHHPTDEDLVGVRTIGGLAEVLQHVK